MKINSNPNNEKKPATPNELNGRHYWRSLEALTETPGFKQFMDDEFLPGASENDGINRRHFFKIMAASFAFAGFGLSGCRRPEQRILPYSKQPERTVPGVPVYYATSLPSGKDNIPLVVETHQSRPTKIEGNPHYAPYGGHTNAFAQASILDLYDPDRATKSQKGNKTLSQSEVYDLFQSIYNKYKGKGKGLAFLAEPSTSPTRNRIVADLKKAFPDAIWAEYSPVSHPSPETATEGIFSDLSANQQLRPVYSFKQAKRILSLDANFLFSEPGALQYTSEYAQKRRAVDADGDIKPERMNRLYQVESNYSTTGGMADHRLRMASNHIKTFAALITAELLEQKNIQKEWTIKLRNSAKDLPDTAKGISLEKWAHECVKDLLKHKGEALILAGSHQPTEVHQLAYFLNQLLNAIGKTVQYLKLPENTFTVANITELAKAVKKNQIKKLIVIGGNPAYNAPKDLQFIFKKSPDKTIIRLGYHQDETTAIADYHVATNHYLESWSDGRTYDGTTVPVQPMIHPLFDGISELECLARISGQVEKDPYTLVFTTFKTLVPNATQNDFDRFLNDGFLPQSAFESITPKVNVEALKEKQKKFNFSSSKLSASKLEILIQPSGTIYDGRYNNNGWCQELPDSMTKICWDNAICISPHLAQTLGIHPKQTNLLQVSAKTTNTLNKGREKAPVGQLTQNGTTVEGPIHIQPGLADYTVVLSMGYGRKNTGRVGEGTGFDVFPLVVSDAPHINSGAKLELIEKTKYLAGTQDHWSMEGRAIIRETDVENYKHHPDFVDHVGMEAHSPAIYGSDKKKSLQEKVLNQYRGYSLYQTPTFGGKQQWGMSIDLNTCISCNACVVACQSENNIPVVGKDQVLRGREMHWIRIDRYYSSSSENEKEVSDDPEVSLQPMACQHCEMAPCESVCPVNATVHDEEGLNTMAYNRCVGTRYCANNCPYKVRRFNFFDWNKRDINELYKGPIGKKGTLDQNNGLQQMQRNPDVTVRMRGVMEKCTYCVQRIQEAKINQKIKAQDTDDVSVPDGAIKTACQQVCPTDSIIFGDVADAQTKVSKSKKSPRDYSVLGYLNTRPRTTYLARLRNPNKKITGKIATKHSAVHHG